MLAGIESVDAGLIAVKKLLVGGHHQEQSVSTVAGQALVSQAGV
jgi:hypothetical protein